MLYTIKISAECAEDLANTLENPDVVFENLVVDALTDVFDFIAVQEVTISPYLQEEILPTPGSN